MASADGAVLAASCHKFAHRHGVSQPASWPIQTWQMGELCSPGLKGRVLPALLVDGDL